MNGPITQIKDTTANPAPLGLLGLGVTGGTGIFGAGINPWGSWDSYNNFNSAVPFGFGGWPFGSGGTIWTVDTPGFGQPVSGYDPASSYPPYGGGSVPSINGGPPGGCSQNDPTCGKKQK